MSIEDKVCIQCPETHASNTTSFFERCSVVISSFGYQLAKWFKTIFGSQVESYLGAGALQLETLLKKR